MSITNEIEFIRSNNDIEGLANAPLLKFVLFGPNNMDRLYNLFKNYNSDRLDEVKAEYVVTPVNDHDNVFVSIVYDILVEDIDDPQDVKFYIRNKRSYQTLTEFRPDLRLTFIYENSRTEFLKTKIIRAVNKIKDSTANDTPVIISMPWVEISHNAHMQHLISDTIHDNFDVINEIMDNENFNKYIIIRRRSKT